MNKSYDVGLVEMWIRCGTGMYSSYIQIHKMHLKVGDELSTYSHIIVGCDSTSKFGIKDRVLRIIPDEDLKTFGEDIETPLSYS